MTLPVAVILVSLFALPAHAERLKVATTFTVIADMARNVAGEGAEVVSITEALQKPPRCSATSTSLTRRGTAPRL